jgi:glycosyltransferase involved in cell wall biosynthesis
MRVLHCCLAAFYIDNYTYQENIMPLMHRQQGHEVMIVASTETYVTPGKLCYLPAGTYATAEGIPITRLPYFAGSASFLERKLRIYSGLGGVLDEFRPEVLFLHDCQFLSIRTVVRYLRQHPGIRVFVDGHTDFINSARGFISKYVLHMGIYRWCAQTIAPYTERFYGTLPVRSDFFHDVYGISRDKIELLPMGVDLTDIDLNARDDYKADTRRRLGIEEDTFVIVTGGKLDRRKGIHLLMKAISGMENRKVKLLVFGTPTKEMEETFAIFASSPAIISTGWVAGAEISHYLLAGDLAFFPGTHSVLWEQAVGLGLPTVFKRWAGIDHIDLGGNCQFIDEVTVTSLQEVIKELLNNKNTVAEMARVAETMGPAIFSYAEIAERAIAAR